MKSREVQLIVLLRLSEEEAVAQAAAVDAKGD